MFYLVILTYTRPIAEVHMHLETHRDWLAENIHAGKILIAGPLEDRMGGFVLARSDSREDLDQLLAQDSFAEHQLVEHQIRGFDVSMRSHLFPTDWAPAAKVIA